MQARLASTDSLRGSVSQQAQLPLDQQQDQQQQQQLCGPPQRWLEVQAMAQASVRLATSWRWHQQVQRQLQSSSLPPQVGAWMPYSWPAWVLLEQHLPLLSCG